MHRKKDVLFSACFEIISYKSSQPMNLTRQMSCPDEDGNEIFATHKFSSENVNNKADQSWVLPILYYHYILVNF